jgi:hypothetical protein
MNRCSFGFHKWSKWSGVTEWNGVRVYPASGVEHKYTMYLQERTCTRCGKHEKNAVKGVN